MKILLLTFLILTTALYISAQQTFEWGVTAGGEKEDVVNDIVHFENHVYVTGCYSGKMKSTDNEIDAKGMTDIYLIRLDKKGNTNWIKSLGGEGADQAMRLTNGDECILMAGEISGAVHLNKKEFAGDGKALFVASWGNTGKIKWLIRVGYTGNATLDVLETAPDGTILAGGMISGTITVGKKTLSSRPGRRAYSFSLSPEGKLIEASLTGGKGDHRLVAAKYGTDGSRYMLFNVYGWMTHGDDIEPYSQNEDFKGLVLVKELQDKTKWVKYFKGDGYIEGVQLTIGNENSVSACINYGRTITLPDTILSTNALQDVAILNYSNNGELNWLKQLQSPVICFATDAMQTRNGKLLITGYFRDIYSFGENNILADNIDVTESMFLAQLNNDGQLSWHDEPGQQASAFSKSLTIGNEGNIYMTGGFKNTITFEGQPIQSKGKEDILVAKYFNCEQLEVEIIDEGPLCKGENRELEVLSGGFETFLWNDSVWGKTYYASSPGEYSVEAFDAKGCSAKDTIPIVLSDEFELGLEPETNLYPGEEVELAATGGFIDYKWNDGIAVATRIVGYNNEMDSIIYIVTAETQNGCFVSDTALVYFPDDEFNKLKSYNNSSLKVYPNPVHNELSWYFGLQKSKNVLVKLLDEKGVLIYLEKIENYIPNSIQKIDMSSLASGNYMLNLTVGDNSFNEKIVKK